MRKCRVCEIEKPFSDFEKNLVRKDGLCTRCISCTKEHQANQKKQWSLRNLEKVRERARVYAQNNKEKSKARSAKFYAENPGYHKERAKQRYQEKPEIFLERQQKRRAEKKNSMPAWAEKERLIISRMYECAKIMRELSGYSWDVDHIVPISNKLVCGLHTISNLLAIPSFLNKKKGNRYWPDMPEIGR